jgi:hypothetical protein
MKKILSLAMSLLIAASLVAPSMTYAEDSVGAEAQILSMQKDGVKAVRNFLETYMNANSKETGNFTLSVSGGDTSTSGKVSLSLDSYTYILSYLKNSQDFHVKGNLSVDLNKAASQQKMFEAKIGFDVRFQSIGQDAYITLTSLTSERTASDKQMEDEFDSALAEIKKHEGKTYKLPLGKTGIEDPIAVYKKINAALDVLDSQSLLEVQSEKNGVSTMRFKRSTIQALNIAVGNKKNANISELNDFKSSKITFQQKDGTQVLRLADRKSVKNFLQIARNNGSYSMNFENHTGNKFKGSDTSLFLSATSATIRSSERSQYGSTTFSLDWKDGQMSSKLVGTSKVPSYKPYTRGVKGYNIKTTTFETSGSFDPWNRTWDLGMKYNGTPVGQLQLSSSENGYSYKVQAKIPEFPTLQIDAFGAATIERGNFDIVAPTQFEEVKRLDF